MPEPIFTADRHNYIIKRFDALDPERDQLSEGIFDTFAKLHDRTREFVWQGTWESQSGFLYYGPANTPDDAPEQPTIFYVEGCSDSYSPVYKRAWVRHLIEFCHENNIPSTEEGVHNPGNDNGGSTWFTVGPFDEMTLENILVFANELGDISDDRDINYAMFETDTYEKMRQEEETEAFADWWDDLVRSTPFEYLENEVPTWSEELLNDLEYFEDEGYYEDSRVDKLGFVFQVAIETALAGGHAMPEVEELLAHQERRDEDQAKWDAQVQLYLGNPVVPASITGNAMRMLDGIYLNGLGWELRSVYELRQPPLFDYEGGQNESA